jgi:hypothetical protein
MDIRFGTRDLLLLCNSRARMVKRWGAAGADLVGQRLQELEAAETLADVALFAHLRVTTAGSPEVWIDSAEPVRLLVAWPEAEFEDQITWEEVTEVVVVDIVMEERKEGDKDVG